MKVKKRRIVLLLCQLALLLGVACLSAYALYHAYHLWSQDKRTMEQDRGLLCISVQHMENPFSLPNTHQTIESFQSLYTELCENDAYLYLELYAQFIYLDAELPFGNPSDSNEDGFEAMDALQISMDTYA